MGRSFFCGLLLFTSLLLVCFVSVGLGPRLFAGAELGQAVLTLSSAKPEAATSSERALRLAVGNKLDQVRGQRVGHFQGWPVTTTWERLVASNWKQSLRQ